MSGPERVKVWACRGCKSALLKPEKNDCADTEAWLVFAPHDADPMAGLDEMLARHRAAIIGRQDDAITALEADRDALRAAGRDLYLRDCWLSQYLTADEGVRAWEEFRDALGIEPGTATPRGLGATLKGAK